MKKQRPFYVRLGIVAAVFLFCCGSLRPDELDCEEGAWYVYLWGRGLAAAAAIDCEYVAPAGCCDSDGEGDCGGRNPDLTETQSDCLRKITCASLCTAVTAGAKLSDLCPP
jgi:hypothetical protein